MAMTPLPVKLIMPNRVQPQVTPRPSKPGCYTNKLDFFKKTIMDEVIKKKYAADFLEPVDTDVLQIPNYFELIAHPMDLQTIMKRLENNYYRNVLEAMSDFEQVLTNCFTYNRRDSDVGKRGVELEKFYESQINLMPLGPEVPMKLPVSIQNSMQTCRDHLKKLQANTANADAHARNYFMPKWESLQKKLDKNYFKTEDEFTSHVEGLFKKYHDGASMIYQGTFGRALTSTSKIPESQSPPEKSVIGSEDVKRLFDMVQELDSGMRLCLGVPSLWDSCRLRELLGNLNDTIDGLKQRTEVGSEQVEEPQSISVFAHEVLSPDELEDIITVRMDSSGDEEDNEIDDKQDFIFGNDPRLLQMMILRLGSENLREIVHMIVQLEDISMEKSNVIQFDVRTFQNTTLLLLKNFICKLTKLDVQVEPASDHKSIRLSEILTDIILQTMDDPKRSKANIDSILPIDEPATSEINDIADVRHDDPGQSSGSIDQYFADSVLVLDNSGDGESFSLDSNVYSPDHSMANAPGGDDSSCSHSDGQHVEISNVLAEDLDISESSSSEDDE